MSLRRTYKRVLAATALAGFTLATCLMFGLSPVGAATSKATTVSVTQGKPSELRFELSRNSVPLGQVTFDVVNKGRLAHDFKICASPTGGTANACTGKVTRLLSPGQSATLAYTFKTKGAYEYLCTVPGHAAAGMKGDLNVG